MFEALATRSSGFAFTLGRRDGEATLEEVVEHTTALDRGLRPLRSEPATRSRTVRDTTISPAPTVAMTRAAMWTAIPPTSSPRSSTSPM
jgi:hypothetical protein